jgi:Aldo/keto reductase family
MSVDYAKLGSAGMKVSRICLGMMSYGSQAERAWHLDETAAEPIVKAAADGGITFFDTADTYSGGVSEQITGRLLGRLFGHREDYVLATKVYFPMGPGPNDRGLSRKHVLSAIDASLRRLRTEYVDLYQIHRWDYDTPVEHASHCSCCWSWRVKQSSLAVSGLDTEPFAASLGEVDGGELAALDLVQHGLAGDAGAGGGLAEGQPAVGGLGPDPVAELLVDADLPGCSRGELLAGDEAVA